MSQKRYLELGIECLHTLEQVAEGGFFKTEWSKVADIFIVLPKQNHRYIYNLTKGKFESFPPYKEVFIIAVDIKEVNDESPV
jgi:hypothetical protein